MLFAKTETFRDDKTEADLRDLLLFGSVDESWLCAAAAVRVAAIRACGARGAARGARVALDACIVRCVDERCS